MMRSRAISPLSIVVVLFATSSVTIGAQCAEEKRDFGRVVELPSDIARELRSRNAPGHRTSCPDSSIFVHGFRYLSIDDGNERVIWFLGAPDYMCETNSFISAIVDSGGNWTIGRGNNTALGSREFLEGTPVLFQFVGNVGFFLTSEWQVEGPGNFLHYSVDGIEWVSLDLPATTPKDAKNHCCFAQSLEKLCVAEDREIYISFEDTAEFEAGIWRAPIDDAFPGHVNWKRTAKLPNDVSCDQLRSQSFMPRSLVEKTKDGAIFDVFLEWKVRIPGATK